MVDSKRLERSQGDADGLTEAMVTQEKLFEIRVQYSRISLGLNYSVKKKLGLTQFVTSDSDISAKGISDDMAFISNTSYP